MLRRLSRACRLSQSVCDQVCSYAGVRDLPYADAAQSPNASEHVLDPYSSHASAYHHFSSRLASSLGTSTSAPHALLCQAPSLSWATAPTCTSHLQRSTMFLRGLKVLKRRFELPDEVKAAMNQELRMARHKPPMPSIPALEPRPMVEGSRRVGCIAYKAGMTQEWDEHGVRVPLTVLWIDDCQVVGIKWPELHGYWALQVGAGYSVQNNLHPGQTGFYLKQGVPFKAIQTEFKVSPDAVIPIGTSITAAHFMVGQRVDVTGWTKNKGFQGVMKRWNFKGLPASHGVSLAHRSPGSIGNRTSPGKVWKGKKMPGQLGDERCTVHDCLVYKVDAARNLIYIRGQVPGPKGQEVYLRDALNTRHQVRLKWQLPYPTCTEPGAAALADLGRAGMMLALQNSAESVAGGLIPSIDNMPDIQVFRENKDPYIPYSKETDYFEVKWKKSD